MSRRKLIAANWKMNKTIREAKDFAHALKESLASISGCDLVLLPPFFAFNTVAIALQGTEVKVGAQDLFWEMNGAFTGEVSGAMIKDAGGDYVLIGHSERRTIMGESDRLIARKLKAALACGLIPILCVGEKLPEREAGQAEDIVKKQLLDALESVSSGEAKNLVIAYEPIWAIGTGKTATADDAEEMHVFIRKLIDEKYSTEVSENLRIQYGGSVKPENAPSLLERGDIDGALIGGASLDVEKFIAIAAAAPGWRGK